MPSLRRTFSSPSVRSAPYPSSLSSSTQAGTRAHGHGHRRSSGSETSGRRVLADIEWWRVAGGQRDPDADQESDERVDRASGEVAETGFGGLSTWDAGAERPTTPVSWAASNSLEALHVLPIPFAALGVIPQTPTRRGHTLEGSTSSIESSPEPTGPSIEGLRRELADLSLDHTDHGEQDLMPSLQRRPLAPLIRSHSLADPVSFHNKPMGQYADFTISPLSSNSPSFMN